MFVYVVFKGWYEDERIDFITSSEVVAKEYCELHKEDDDSLHYKPHELDRYTIEDINNQKEDRCPVWDIYFRFYVDDGWELAEKNFRIDYDGTKKRKNSIKEGHIGGYYYFKINIYGYEMNQYDLAIKIARDMLKKHLKESYGCYEITE